MGMIKCITKYGKGEYIENLGYDIFEASDKFNMIVHTARKRLTDGGIPNILRKDRDRVVLKYLADGVWETEEFIFKIYD